MVVEGVSARDDAKLWSNGMMKWNSEVACKESAGKESVRMGVFA